MHFQYETKRLFLRILEPSEAEKVLNFQLNNMGYFERYEASRPTNFYTLDYQKNTLQCEYNMAVQSSLFRYYAFLKGHPDQIIGTVCYRDIKRAGFFSCETGYKFDHRYWHHGYASETLEKTIDLMFYEEHLHRIQASVMPENDASIHLLESLGFEQEGIARQSALVCGQWQDHIRYALIRP